ncbi:MAG TPA: nucleotide exchange factor GrpE [Solirubrobacteraceae bacterium]|jgi:molecular chaperone GrpE|nr:nucleotide exchange factor GrpE [Solirubrobacteraceae bacterium]
MGEVEQQIEEGEPVRDAPPPAPGMPGAGPAGEDGSAAEDGDAASSSSPQSIPGQGMDPEAGAPPSQKSIPGQGTDPAGTIEEELDEMVKTAAERDEYLALAQRTQADFENYRKRVARDAAQAQDRGVAKLAKELLPALDNLDRAIEAAEAEDPLLAGVRLVRAELAAALARVGIESFAPLGEPFDPNLHEAVAQQPVEGAESGTVAEVFQNGYRMGETIVRPARVLVAA